jgi:hypothetical protein
VPVNDSSDVGETDAGTLKLVGSMEALKNPE